MVQIRVNVMLLEENVLSLFVPRYFKYPVPVPSPWLEVCDRSGFKKNQLFPLPNPGPEIAWPQLFKRWTALSTG